MGPEGQTLADARDHAWKYFELHANQRMSLFNFFLVLSTFLAAALGWTIQSTSRLEVIGIFLGMLLFTTSVVFGYLDRRTSLFIKLAEDALADIENAMPVASAKLVQRERAVTLEQRGKKKFGVVPQHLTYRACFGKVFFCMGLLGVGGAAVVVLKMVGCVNP